MSIMCAEREAAAPTDYLLGDGGEAELERLQLQARVWEPHAEAMLDEIGVAPGSAVADLGCGAVGILEPLSRRVGPEGCVIGVETDAQQLAAARQLVRDRQLANVEVARRDAYRTRLPRQCFDLTHVRFLFAPVGRDPHLLTEMIELTRPGGVVAAQEPDAAAWSYYPHLPAFALLKTAILSAFLRGGGDFNAGRRTHALFRQAGLRDVRVRTAVLALQHEHPYKRLPVMLARSLRRRIIDGGILTPDALDRLIAECDRHARHPETVMVSFTVTQVWGRKPG
ncbi:MAG TPA: methyltransferase domain-containing protein [Tepidisphaeraceae bacterium]|nr:methyltransferase domain-containing protein [Tepidisphaeraceae bacterium]